MFLVACILRPIQAFDVVDSRLEGLPNLLPVPLQLTEYSTGRPKDLISPLGVCPNVHSRWSPVPFTKCFHPSEIRGEVIDVAQDASIGLPSRWAIARASLRASAFAAFFTFRQRLEVLSAYIHDGRSVETLGIPNRSV